MKALLLADEIPNRVLAVVTAAVIAFVIWPGALFEYLIGLIVGGVLVWAFVDREPDPLDETHPAIIRAWIYEAHRSHAGSSWAIEDCTEPECEAGVPILDHYREKGNR